MIREKLKGMGMGDRFSYVPVANVAALVIGGTPSRSVSNYWGGSIKWAAAKDIVNVKGRYLYSTEESITKEGIDNSAAKILPRGTVVITARGTVGALAQLGENMAFNQTCYGLIAKETILSDFLYYALKGSLSEMHSLSYGTIFDTITIKTFDHLTIPLPSYSKQKAIASILGALDDKIELNRRMNETFEAMAKAIFKSWFVDFDPIPGFGPHKEWQNSPLGKIPKGWKVGKIKECCSRVENGGTPRKDESSYWNPATIPWLTSGEVRQDIVISTENKISEGGLANSSAKLWPKGTTVVALYGATAGQVCLLASKMCANQACCGLVPLPHMQSFNYLYVSSSVQQFEHLARGSAQQNLSQQIVANLQVIIPHTTTLENFEEIITPLFNRQILNLEQSHNLAAIRDALLPKLLSGEIRVKNAEKFVEETL